jgi:hypothetical protein
MNPLGGMLSPSLWKGIGRCSGATADGPFSCFTLEEKADRERGRQETLRWGTSMKIGIGVALVGALLLGGCQTAGRVSPMGGAYTMSAHEGDRFSPVGTRVSARSPDPTKWQSRRIGAVMVWNCRPLACADTNTGVAVAMTRAPTRNPDPEALRKLAKILPAQTNAQNAVLEIASDGQEKVESLASHVTKLRGYPAITTETRRSGRGKPTYIANAHLFVGLAHVRIASISLDRAVSKRHLEDFVAALHIDDRPPGAPAEEVAPAEASASAPAPAS